jgi:hypothetical protein
VDVGHRLGVEVHQVMAVFGDKPLKAVAHPVNVPHPVKMIELQNNGPDNVVGAGTQTAAGDDGAMDLGGIEIDVGPGTGHFQSEGLLALQALPIVQGIMDQNLVRIRYEGLFYLPATPVHHGNFPNRRFHLRLP